MKAYIYNRENFHFMSDYNCQLDQLESKKQGKEIYLLPADATWIKPDDFNIETQYAKWNEEEQKWEINDIELEEIDDSNEMEIQPYISENSAKFLSNSLVEGINEV